MQNHEIERNLRRNEAARYLRDVHGIPTSTQALAKKAVLGGGPPYRKIGKYPLYRPSDLDAWVNSQLSPVVTNTAELSGREPREARR